MIVIFTGLPGSGKSYKLGQSLLEILHRNKKAYEKELDYYWNPKNAKLAFKEPERRMLFTNLKFGQEVEQYYKKYIVYWTELRQLTVVRDADVAIDEIATYFDARLWETLSLEMRRWLSQHRKFGIEIYGTTQDFAQVDKAFRRLTSNLLYLRKIFGSRDISATKEPPKYIYGLSLIQELDPTVYDELKSKFQAVGLFPRFLWIDRKKTSVFDTTAEVSLSAALPKRHIEHVCEKADCPFHKVVHV